MQFRTKLGLVDIPNEDVLAAARDIAGSGRGPSKSAAPLGALAVASCSERLWQALQLKADMFDYLCWLDGMHGPEQLHGVDRLCMASDGTTCWGKSYADAVRVAMEHDKEIFDAMEAASPNGRDEPRRSEA